MKYDVNAKTGQNDFYTFLAFHAVFFFAVHKKNPRKR